MPKAIYDTYQEDAERGDRHSLLIAKNRAGIVIGAESRLSQGIIDIRARDEIANAASQAEIHEFLPVMFIISTAAVTTPILEVPIDDRAHPLSIEYKIENLSRDEFTVVRI